MQQFNFQPLNFSTLGGYQQRYDQARQAADQARRNKYDAFGNIIGSAGEGASNVVNAYGDWRERQDELKRQEAEKARAEAWRQRQWDYQVGRDAIADRLREQEQMRRDIAEREGRRRGDILRRSYLSKYDTPDFYEKYGPQAAFAMERIRNAPDWQEVVSGGESLANAIYQQDMLNAQREEQRRANLGPEASNQIAARMSLMGIDPRDPESSVYRMRDRDFYKDEETRYQINRDISRLDAMIRAGYGNQAMYDQRSALLRASDALQRRMYRTGRGGQSLVDPYGRYTKESDF